MQLTKYFPGLKTLAGIAMILCAPLSMAHNHPRINWSVTIGSPYPAAVYSPPPAIYYEPDIIYTQPRSIYVERPPVLQYRPNHYPGNYYVEEIYLNKPPRHMRHGHHNSGHRHRHRHGHRHD